MSLPLWDVVPETRPYDVEPDPVYCASRLYLPAGSAGRANYLACNLLADHTGSGRDARHQNLHARWTDEMAAESLAVRQASTAPAGPDCLRCRIRPARLKGCCPSCAQTESRAA